MLKGDATTEITAPAADVYARLADVEAYPSWQSFVSDVDVRERDDDGRPVLVASRLDAKVSILKAVLRYQYDAPNAITWTYEDGDLKDMTGGYRIEPLLGGLASVRMEVMVDPGFKLGLLLRGPAETKVRNRVLNGTLRELAATFA